MRQGCKSVSEVASSGYENWELFLIEKILPASNNSPKIVVKIVAHHKKQGFADIASSYMCMWLNTWQCCLVTVWISMHNFLMVIRWGNPTMQRMWSNKHHIIVWAYSTIICLFFGDLPILISTIIAVIAAPLPTFTIGLLKLRHLKSWRPAWRIVLFWKHIFMYKFHCGDINFIWF